MIDDITTEIANVIVMYINKFDDTFFSKKTMLESLIKSINTQATMKLFNTNHYDIRERFN
jgi:uncharacterized membrane protein